MSNPIVRALSHVRHALIALRADAPVLPALLCAEEELLRAIFTEKEVEEYLASNAASIYGRK